jgi:hypothetical protein
LVEDNLAAAVSDVLAEDFEEAPLNARVQAMGWLGPRAVAHRQANAELHERVEALLPLAFGTVFRDEGGVRDLLITLSAALTKRLEPRAQYVGVGGGAVSVSH